MNPAAAPAPDSAAARAQVVAAMNRYNRFMRAGPPDSIAAMFTNDGELYDSENSLKGHGSIRAFYEPLTRNVRIQEANSTTHAFELWGTTALQWGEYEQNASAAGGAVTVYRGRFVAEWEHSPDGRWLIRRMMVQPLHGR
jgi:ketosteroid isomerase-like protein